MKRPYITQFERLMIISGTLTGDCIMFRFRVNQLFKAITNKLVKISYLYTMIKDGESIKDHKDKSGSIPRRKEN